MNPPQSMLPAKLFYFFVYAALAALSPFIALYYQQIGLSGPQIGLLVAIPSLMLLVGAPLFGAIADATQKHKPLLLLTVCSAAVAGLAFTWVTSYGWLILLVIVYAFFMSPIIPLVDKTVLELLGKQQHLYGRQRLWGAVGWGISALIMGLLIDQLGLNRIFTTFFCCMFGVFYAVYRLPVSQASLKSHFWHGLRNLLANVQWAAFLGIVFIAGVGMAMTNNYLFLYMNDLGASSMLMGLALAIATISELMVMYYSSYLLNLLGTQGLLIGAIVAFILRLLAYSMIQTPWLVLGVQLLHGPSFAAMWMAGVTRASELAPPGMAATAQGLFTGVSMGLAGFVGALVGGVLYQTLGSALMFRWVGVGLLVALVLFILAGRLK